ncbi:hypothetical protein AOXY_G9776 [Acipenser oxyrinchus oxyrinchus]|uniref:EF-hand calcium-binding domain-containing protein 6 n=1 Tax=Acipenser oxyrinchus oxyrinchus TaxID=40147 RepID=A0AAD8G7K8_ACIOX|nr:hypothetical protein AOXY_G9776 [Acipenser oxyrinchus oxyrinchus]
MPCSIVSTSLPNISPSFLKAGHLNAVLIKEKCSFPRQEIKNREIFWNKKSVGDFAHGRLRVCTARANLGEARAHWTQDTGSSSEKNVRAQTAMGRLSMELWPKRKHSIHEIIGLIKEKLHSQLHSVRQMFRANDPKGEGTVSKEALNRILWNLCGYLTPQQVNHVLTRVGLVDHPSFSFDEFISCFLPKKVMQNEWLSPSRAKQLGDVGAKQKRSDPKCERMHDKNAERIWDLVKEKVNESDFSIEKYLPLSCLQASGNITAVQLKKSLDSMGLVINDDEFDRLWLRINKNNTQAINTNKLIKRLGVPVPDVCEPPRQSNTGRGMKSAVRNLSFEEVVSVLKSKLNESCLSMLHAFAKYDKDETGLATRTAFRQVLAQFNILMGAIDLEHLLARLNLRSKDGMVHYERFVEKLGSRSPLSVLNHTMENLNQSDRTAFLGSAEGLTASEAEVRLLELCQGLFLRLLTAFRKVDISDEGSVSLEKFKEILEKTFQIQLTEEQLQGAVSIFGDKETNLVSYTKFFALFHNRPTTCELKEEVERCSPLIHVNFHPDKLRYRESFKGDWSRYSHAQKIRPLQELRGLVYSLLQKNFRLFCRVFINVCQNDECTADKEKLDSILQRMNIILLPMELGKLWYSLPISYPVEAISLRKFLRHFSKLKIEKESGPREENPVALTQIKLRNHIIKQWKQIKSILRASDPSGSGKVPLRVVYALFLTLKCNVLPAEMDDLCLEFDRDKDGHFHYIQFLKFYVKSNKGT